MKRGILATLLGTALLFASGCKSKTDENAAIREGVLKHLASLNMLNVANMDVKVAQATVNGNQAQAQIEIRSKGGAPNAEPMKIGYDLEKRGEEWVVTKTSGMGGGMQHPGPGEAPPAGSTPGTMPPGHPNVTGGGQNSSAHPDFNAILNNAQSGSQQTQPSAPPASNAKP